MKRETLWGLPLVFGGEMVERSRKTPHGVKEAVGGKRAKPLRPNQCQSHMRATLAREFEEIVTGFVDEAKKGSCQHVKLVTELLKPMPKSASRKKGSVARLLERLDNEGMKKNG